VPEFINSYLVCVILVPVLESILSQLLTIVKDETAPNEVLQLAFQLLYHITKVSIQSINDNPL